MVGHKESDEMASEEITEVFQDVLDILSEAPKVEEVVGEMDLEGVIQQMEASLEEINAKTDELFEQTGMSKEELEEFANNADNFSPGEWDLLQQIQDKVKVFQSETDRITSEGMFDAPATSDDKPKKKRGKKSSKKKPVTKKDWLAG